MKTAEEFLLQKPFILGMTRADQVIAMIEFAKMHVQEALRLASEKAFVEYVDLQTNEKFDYTDVITDDDVGADVNKDSILNAYSLENII